MSNAFWHCNCDLEPLLIASVKIARLEKEAKLSLDAMEALRETLQVRENTIALLEARLRVSDIKMRRRMDNDMASVIEMESNRRNA